MTNLSVAIFHDLPSGGAKRTLYEQARRLQNRGHHLEAFLPETAEETIFPLAQAVQTTHQYRQPAPASREKLMEGRAGFREWWGWGRHFFRLIGLDQKIAHDIDRREFDVVLAHHSQFIHSPFLFRFLKTPALFYCHEPMRAAFEEGIAHPTVRVFIRHTLARVDAGNLKQATRVATNSKFSAKQFENCYGLRPRVLYHGIDHEHFTPQPSSGREAEFFLSVGALDPLKGFDFVIQSLGEVPPKYRHPLRIVSDRQIPGEMERLQRLARQHEVELDFQFRVSDQRLVELYNGASVVLYAPRREPFGLVPLEAMACERPVLAVPEGGIQETVIDGETGFLAPRDPEQFGARLTSLMKNPQKRSRVARRAREIVKTQWSWEQAIEQLEEELTTLSKENQ